MSDKGTSEAPSSTHGPSGELADQTWISSKVPLAPGIPRGPYARPTKERLQAALAGLRRLANDD